jgi:uncharacterized phage infection (PIP) family protein YhgE
MDSTLQLIMQQLNKLSAGQEKVSNSINAVSAGQEKLKSDISSGNSELKAVSTE